ncbi:MAG: SulP family inorganic anion transporter [Bacteroidales bacterium]|nr:SulP family inorganic anion transporter [Bacteroidales bacterium]
MREKIYDFKNLKGDLSGGLVAGIVALPLALAFGVQSGMGAIAGLYGAIAVGILAAALGGTRTQASGPTGPMTVVSATFIALAIGLAGNLENAMGIIVATFILGGLFQIFFGLINIGNYIKYFPYPVISGFMSGVGLIIILLQIFPFAGVTAPSSTIGVFRDFSRLISELNLSAIGIGGITVLIFYLFPKITKAIPSALVALLAASLVAYIFNLDVPLIGEIPSGLPSLKIDGLFNIDPAAYVLIIEYAFLLAVLGSIDSLLTSVIADNITKTKHNSNRELIGQGIGNAVAGLIGGIPGAGATKGTVVNINAGGKTRLSGVIHGLFLLVVLLGAGKYAAYIPIPVLAGILIPVGLNIIDAKGLKHLLLVPRSDAFVLVLVLLITTFGNLIYAVAIGVILASVLFMKRSGDIAEKGTSGSTLADFKGEQPWDDEKRLFEEFKDSIYVKHLYGPLFFGFTSHFLKLFKNLDDRIKVLIIRMDRVPYIDQTGLYAMEETLFDLNKKGLKVIFIGLQSQPGHMFRSIDIIPDLIPEENLFETMDDGLIWLKDNLPGSRAKQQYQ